LAPDGTTRRRVAFVGTGHRAELFFSALLGDHADQAVPVALCDPNPGRMDYYQALWQSAHPGTELDTYVLDPGQPVTGQGGFEQMLETQRPDVVVVATVDATHAHYVVTALDRGVDVICEKPLTTDLDGVHRIAEAARRSDNRLIVTFNYRYSPRNSLVKQLVADGEIGTVTSVHFEWLLDTVHGADYFRRWHRNRTSSGGLLVHKSTHHFDLVNWWLADRPETVSAHASLRFYGAEAARGRGIVGRPARSRDAITADPDLDDPFAIDLAADDRLRQLYLDNEDQDGYLRDQDVFGEGVTIDDNMAVLARYHQGALLTYSLHAHAPWEGYRVALNGTAGRLEIDVVERAATKRPDASEPPDPGDRRADTVVTLQKHWGPAERIEVTSGSDDHGGGDALLLADLFGPAASSGEAIADPLGRQAGYLDGVASVLTGIAANTSAASGLFVRLDELGAGIFEPVAGQATTGAQR
jgi:predicted dehydrogenase